MDLDIETAILLYLPASIYYLFWFKIRGINSKLPQIIMIIISLIILFSIGTYSYEKKSYNELTMIGKGIMYTCSVILLGPGLLLLKNRVKRLTIWGFLMLLSLPIAGLYFIFFALLVTNQISGM
jgi:hypothetical protein